MRAISLYQPWASLMSLGAKKIETRSWATNYRGLVAIHASKKWDAEVKGFCKVEPFEEVLFGEAEHQFLYPDDLPRGCFVALGKLRHCLSTTQHFNLIPSDETNEYYFGDYDPGRFMWVFDEIWRLRQPVFARGHQGLWTLEEDEADAVMAMLPEGVEEQHLEEKRDV